MARFSRPLSGTVLRRPFLQHGAVESFDLALGLGQVGAGAFVCDVRAQGVGEGMGAVSASREKSSTALCRYP